MSDERRRHLMDTMGHLTKATFVSRTSAFRNHHDHYAYAFMIFRMYNIVTLRTHTVEICRLLVGKRQLGAF